MWIKLSNGRIELVHHEAHIARLLSEGGQEVADPRVAALAQQETEEQSDGSQNNTDRPDSSGQEDDHRPRRRKPAVH